MIRTNAVPRPVRTAAAFVGVAGALVLAGCATDTTTTTDSTAEETTPATSETTESTDSGTSSDSAVYADGTYTAEGTYQTPSSVETVTVTLTLEDDVITAVDVTGDPQARESQQYQAEFIGGIADEVVGQNIDEISVDRVAGSSLTSGGFNEAVEEIKAEAAL